MWHVSNAKQFGTSLFLVLPSTTEQPLIKKFVAPVQKISGVWVTESVKSCKKMMSQQKYLYLLLRCLVYQPASLLVVQDRTALA